MFTDSTPIILLFFAAKLLLISGKVHIYPNSQSRICPQPYHLSYFLKVWMHLIYRFESSPKGWFQNLLRIPLHYPRKFSLVFYEGTTGTFAMFLGTIPPYLVQTGQPNPRKRVPSDKNRPRIPFCFDDTAQQIPPNESNLVIKKSGMGQKIADLQILQKKKKKCTEWRS